MRIFGIAHGDVAISVHDLMVVEDVVCCYEIFNGGRVFRGHDYLISNVEDLNYEPASIFPTELDIEVVDVLDDYVVTDIRQDIYMYCEAQHIYKRVSR